MNYKYFVFSVLISLFTSCKQEIQLTKIKGKRIEINEKDRLKTGEQKQLTKGSSYDVNIKKFKDLKA